MEHSLSNSLSSLISLCCEFTIVRTYLAVCILKNTQDENKKRDNAERRERQSLTKIGQENSITTTKNKNYNKHVYMYPLNPCEIHACAWSLHDAC